MGIFKRRKTPNDGNTSLKVTDCRCIQKCGISGDQVFLSALNYEYFFTLNLSILGMLLSGFVREINVNRW